MKIFNSKYASAIEGPMCTSEEQFLFILQFTLLHIALILACVDFHHFSLTILLFIGRSVLLFSHFFKKDGKIYYEGYCLQIALLKWLVGSLAFFLQRNVQPYLCIICYCAPASVSIDIISFQPLKIHNSPEKIFRKI